MLNKTPTTNFQQIRLFDLNCCYKFTYLMANSADPDQLASQKPTDLDLHCLLRKGMLCSAREGLIYSTLDAKSADDILLTIFLYFPEDSIIAHYVLNGMLPIFLEK